MKSAVSVLLAVCAVAHGATLLKSRSSCDPSEIAACGSSFQSFMQSADFANLISGVTTGSFLGPVNGLVDNVCRIYNEAVPCMKAYYDRCHPEYSPLMAIAQQSLDVCHIDNIYQKFESAVRCVKDADLVTLIPAAITGFYTPEMFETAPNLEQTMQLQCQLFDHIRAPLSTAVHQKCSSADAQVMTAYFNYAYGLYSCQA